MESREEEPKSFAAARLGNNDDVTATESDGPRLLGKRAKHEGIEEYTSHCVDECVTGRVQGRNAMCRVFDRSGMMRSETIQ
jgi:hypothetical protein